MMRALLLAGVVAWAWTGSARAAFTVFFVQSGSDVVATGSGTINLTGLQFDLNSNSIDALVDASLPGLITGTGAYSVYDTTITGPLNFGSGQLFYASTTAGDAVAFEVGDFKQIAVPIGYVSGAFLNDTATYTNATFKSLGLDLGTYTYNHGTAGDTFTVQIGPVATAVPEPGSLALLGMGLAEIVAVRRRRGT